MGKDLHGNDIGKGFIQRKDGRYEARATIGEYKVDIYGLNLTELRKEFELEKARVLLIERCDREGITLKEWTNEWFETFKAPILKSEVSRKVYKRKINNTYVDILGDKFLKDITQFNIQTATNDLFEIGYSRRLIKEAYSALKDCFEIAVVNNYTKHNPCVSVFFKNEYDKPAERRVLSHTEQNMFLEETEGGFYEEPYKILLSTGMRIGEFSGLWWSDVDFENKCIHINRSMQTAYQDGHKIEQITTPKTQNSYRTIPFFNETEQLFNSWREKQLFYKDKLGDRWRANPELGDLVFTSSMGSPITRYVLSHDLNKVERNINLKEKTKADMEHRKPIKFEHIHPHCFRHTFATRCFEKGLDPLFIQQIMGHSNYSVTLSYTHLLEDKKKEEIAKIKGNFLD